MKTHTSFSKDPCQKVFSIVKGANSQPTQLIYIPQEGFTYKQDPLLRIYYFLRSLFITGRMKVIINSSPDWWREWVSIPQGSAYEAELEATPSRYMVTRARYDLTLPM